MELTTGNKEKDVARRTANMKIIRLKKKKQEGRGTYEGEGWQIKKKTLDKVKRRGECERRRQNE